jgi:hypothetical protein
MSPIIIKNTAEKTSVCFSIVLLTHTGMKRASAIFTWNTNSSTTKRFDRGSTWKTISYIGGYGNLTMFYEKRFPVSALTIQLTFVYVCLLRKFKKASYCERKGNKTDCIPNFICMLFDRAECKTRKHLAQVQKNTVLFLSRLLILHNSSPPGPIKVTFSTNYLLNRINMYMVNLGAGISQSV